MSPLAGHVINLDLMPRPQVDVLGDAHCLPFLPGSLDGVMICNVLEIVPDPQRLASSFYYIGEKSPTVLTPE